MTFTPHNLFDWKDRQYQGARGLLTFRCYPDGWLVRYTPYAGDQHTKLEGADIWQACAFANHHSA